MKGGSGELKLGDETSWIVRCDKVEPIETVGLAKLGRVAVVEVDLVLYRQETGGKVIF
jgi:hypothetical protein